MAGDSIDLEANMIRSLLWFLNNPNSFIDNKKPVELLGKDDERIISLAKAFLHPADVF